MTAHFFFLNRQLNLVNQKTANCFILYSTFHVTLKLANQLPTNLINQIPLNFSVANQKAANLINQISSNFSVINQKAANCPVSYRTIYVTSVPSVSHRLLYLFFILSLSLSTYPSLNSAHSDLLFSSETA